MLPNFIVIGSQKSGTTSLHHVLRRHPQVFMPEKKELNFFFHDSEFARGTAHYEAYFASAPDDAVAIGEASPGYICHPDAAKRIRAVAPDAKLILMLRNPIERAYSQYWDNRRSLAEPFTFDQVIEFALRETYRKGERGYFSRGTYIQYIQRYLDYFDQKNLLVLLFDDLRSQPVELYRRCFEFLGVSPDFADEQMTHAFNASTTWSNPVYTWFFQHPGATRHLPSRGRGVIFRGKRKEFRYPAMDSATRKRLVEFYQPWNRELGEFLGRDLSHWEE